MQHVGSDADVKAYPTWDDTMWAVHDNSLTKDSGGAACGQRRRCGSQY